ncbi:hypothetical protein MKX01_031012 [Papaver californicum]|nr:hypothetical protein MKX01_031012 [Papaver californicum]
MANSKYEYVKSFEVEDKLMPSTWIHEFNIPNNEQALKLMNACAEAMFEDFVFKKTTEFYNRRSRFATNSFYFLLFPDLCCKIVSITVSFFTSVYVMKWKEFFPDKDLKSTPSFDARHINNQYNTCFWKLVESGKTKSEAQDRLKGAQTQDKNEILFQLGVNYTELPAIFRKGSCVFKDKVAETVKYNEDGKPVNRQRNKVIADHCDIIGDKFWNDHVNILKED